MVMFFVFMFEQRIVALVKAVEVCVVRVALKERLKLGSLIFVEVFK